MKLDAVENKVMNFYRECRDENLHVSRKRLKLKPLEIYQRLVNENLAEPDRLRHRKDGLVSFYYVIIFQ